MKGLKYKSDRKGCLLKRTGTKKKKKTNINRDISHGYIIILDVYKRISYLLLHTHYDVITPPCSSGEF